MRVCRIYRGERELRGHEKEGFSSPHGSYTYICNRIRERPAVRRDTKTERKREGAVARACERERESSSIPRSGVGGRPAKVKGRERERAALGVVHRGGSRARPRIILLAPAAVPDETWPRLQQQHRARTLCIPPLHIYTYVDPCMASFLSIPRRAAQ